MTSPMHLVVSSSVIDDPSSFHTRTSPFCVTTNLILTSPDSDGSRLRPARMQTWTLPFGCVLQRLESTSFPGT